MSSQPAHTSFDDRTGRLIEAAHRCDGLPAIDEYLPFRSLGRMWAELGNRQAARPWMTYYPCAADDEQPETFTYGAFAAFIERMARMLRTRFDITEGASVATLTINQPFTVAIYFAAWRLGARVVPINPSESDDRVAYIVENSGATVLFVHESARPDLAPLEKILGNRTKLAVVLGDDPAALIDSDSFDGPSEEPPDVSWDAEALVVYTSGTTGNPKGVVLTQKQMFADAWAISQWHDVTEHSVLMNVLPIHHVNGTIVTLLTPAFVGGHVVVNRRFRSKGFWNKLATHNVEIVSVVPTLLQFLFEAEQCGPAGEETRVTHDRGTGSFCRHCGQDAEFRPEELPNFRHFICGAGPLSVELARDFQNQFGLKIVHGYGLSETVCYSCFLPVDLEWHEHNGWMYDHGFPSIGVPVATNEMSIHDEHGKTVPDGTKGEIVIRGHNVMKCYFRNPEANATCFAHGWFRSGDEGFKLRHDGRDYYFITGRIKELIIRGGVNISPFEIDEVLVSMPGIRVGLAVGFDNRYYGEEVGAYVQCESGAVLTPEAVIAYCHEKLPASKCPKVVIFGNDIPVTSTGKFQRGKLKHLFEAHKDTQFKG